MYHCSSLIFCLLLACLIPSFAAFAFPPSSPLTPPHHRESLLRTIASETLSSSSSSTFVINNLERRMGGRIEQAFASAKERGEAAFVTFVTAGYPDAHGTYITVNMRMLTSYYFFH
jgi:hypothetical protein